MATLEETDTDTCLSVKVNRSLPLSSFAGLVASEIKARFGESDVRRVLDSWALLDQGYEHKEFLGGGDLDPVTSNLHQMAHSYVPGLTPKTFWKAEDFEWCVKLEKKYDVIRREFLKAIKNMDKLQKEGNNVWSGALTDDASGYGEGWRTLVLLDRGTWDPTNVQIFSKTAKAVRDAGVPAVEIFFASMQPHSDIKMHSDFTNFVLTSHLAVDIPESGNNKCRITVGDDTRQWINGEVSLFDTSIMHDAVNETDQTRYILMFRVWHPDLSDKERQALQFIYDVLFIPDLVSIDPNTKLLAEEQLKILRTFPNHKQGSGFTSGGNGNAAASKKKKKKKK